MSVKAVDEVIFREEVVERELVLLDFYADWCGPCRMLSPTVEVIAEEHPEVYVGKINVDREGELARRFSIFSIPTLVVMRDGEEVDRAVGVRTREQILEMLEG